MFILHFKFCYRTVKFDILCNLFTCFYQFGHKKKRFFYVILKLLLFLQKYLKEYNIIY